MKYSYRFMLVPAFVSAFTGTSFAQDTVRTNQYGEVVTRTPLIVEQRDGILVFESADQRYRFWFDIRVQMDGAVFTGSTFNPIGNDVAMRRARLGIKADLTEHWYAEWDVDFSKSSAEVKDMYMQYHTGRLTVNAGNFKESISLERNTTSRYVTFLERPVSINALIPDRNLGVQASYHWPLVIGLAGIHFQDMEEAGMVSTREDNNTNFGQNEGYSATGKLIAHQLTADKRAGLHVGIASSYRTPKNDDVLNTVRFSARTASSINRKKYLDTDRITNVDHHTLENLEFAAFLGGVKAQTEFTRATVTRKDTLPSVTFNGMYATASVMLFGGKYRYNTNDGEFTQPTRGNRWGDLELAVRYEYVDLTDKDITGGSGEATLIGLTYHANSNVKLMFNAGYMNHDRFANGRNRLYVGHDASGALTRNPASVVEAKGKAGEKYRMFALRFEVDF
jgi:phosphate-selective porin OprO/OprP